MRDDSSPKPSMVITVEVSHQDLRALPVEMPRVGLYALLKGRGLCLRHLEDWDGTVESWTPLAFTGPARIYRQTIQTKKERAHGTHDALYR